MKIIHREVAPRAAWALEQAGVHPLLAQLYAARGVQSAAELDTDLAALLPPSGLMGIDAACDLLLTAIKNQEHICIVADYDCDGATACAVAVRGLRLLGAQNVSYLVPDRMQDGYGLTPPISQRVAATGATLLITVDNGIASVQGVQAAQDLGLKVLVTDHHLPALGAQPQADAMVNPNQIGCGFASKALAGVGVMFYVLLALRAKLREQGAYGPQTGLTQPKLDGLLPLVALGTVADVVPLDANNRRLVAQGMARMRRGALPAGMAALLDVAGGKAHSISTRDLGFMLGPRINAAGRLADMQLGIECLLSDNPAHALHLAQELNQFNLERREREAEMKEQAMFIVDGLLGAESSQPPPALSVFDESFHEGVVGIVASRLKDRLHRPTFVFAPSGAVGSSHILKGSGRSIAGFHLRDALDLIAKRHPEVLLRFGGHAMAAGCTVAREQFDAFSAALQTVAQEWLSPETLEQRILTDGPLPPEHMRLDIVDSFDACVWGQGFAAPVFSDDCEVLEQRIVGSGHSKLKLKVAGQTLDAIWFGRTDSLPRQACIAYKLEANEWRNARNLQLMIEAVEGY